MKKHKNLLLYSSLMLLLCMLGILLICFWDRVQRQTYLIVILLLLALFAWACGSILLALGKGKYSKTVSRLLIAGNITVFCILLCFGCFYGLAVNHSYSGSFSMTTSLFGNRNVLVVVPHQDDDVNLMGGLIEQYILSGSEVSVVFSTNGDGDLANADVRAAEVVSVLSSFGVKQENIYYLGFGDLWQPQSFGDTNVRHIYNSPDPDAVWTSLHGATATYGTQSIPCYLDLPYTRNNYVYSMEAVIRDVMPDTIFAVDFDVHLDHRATDLFFEEALCRVLKKHPDYHPTVYKGFCYGTAWKAPEDFYGSLNLLSTKKPDDHTWRTSAFGYTWEDRLRFPEITKNLNPLLLNNSVYHSFNGYGSQFAYIRAEAVLNGDKVFWERRTGSLLYDAEITLDGKSVSLLNDFKLKDFADISLVPETASGVACLGGKTLRVTLKEAADASCIYLYDNPSQTENILEGHIVFSDGSQTVFGALRSDGSPTVISFPEKHIQWFEIVPTKTEGNNPGLSEIELYRSVSLPLEDACLMAVDSDDNFVYDYMISGGDTAAFKLYRFPRAEQLHKEDTEIRFESGEERNSYHWNGDSIVVTCAKGSTCSLTVSADGVSTTFSVSNPPALTRAYLTALRGIEKVTVEIRYLVFGLHQVYYRIVG